MRLIYVLHMAHVVIMLVFSAHIINEMRLTWDEIAWYAMHTEKAQKR